MRVNVRSLQGDQYTVDVLPDHLVSDLKALISEKSEGSVPIFRQKLIYKGRTLQDGDIVSEYNLQDGCKIHLILQKDKNTSIPLPPNPSSSSNCSSNPNDNTARDISQVNTQAIQNFDSESHISDEEKTNKRGIKSEFEIILRERLSKLFPLSAVDKIMANLETEINADIDTSSLDDLKLLAKEKLKITDD